MEIICENCQKKIKIPDDKVPKNRDVFLACPECKNKIAVSRKTSVRQNENTSEDKVAQWTLQDLTSETYDASEKPFDFIEEETKTALICVVEPDLQKVVTSSLKQMEYQYKIAEDARDALKQMRYHTFDVVVINEKFNSRDMDSNGVLIFLQHLPMTIRRNIFTVLLSRRFRTMDNMEAFHKSVNLIINLQNINHFHKILTRGIADNEYFYRVFKMAARKIFGI